MDYAAESLIKHIAWKGKIETAVRVPLKTADDLALAYTPGVAQPCLAIQQEPEKSFTLTRRGNTVAVITDGSAVLGLGNIGPEAGMPVMEGKCALFRQLGGVDAVPLCLRTNDTDEIVHTIQLLAGSFGGINLEDISAPRCFEIEQRLTACCDIPVFHDDQHGTAIVTLAALLNAIKLTGKNLKQLQIVLNGAGAAGIAIFHLLTAMGALPEQIILCDRQGAIYTGREHLNPQKQKLAEISNRNRKRGSLSDVLAGADVLIGVSAPGCVTGDMIQRMAAQPIVFAMANPTPEILPAEALAAGAAVVGTGRSDFPNQINNILAFPGIFRGALDVRARNINDAMKLAAVKAIADYIPPEKLSADYIIPHPLDEGVAKAVAAAVAEAARESGEAQV